MTMNDLNYDFVTQIWQYKRLNWKWFQNYFCVAIRELKKLRNNWIEFIAPETLLCGTFVQQKKSSVKEGGK